MQLLSKTSRPRAAPVTAARLKSDHQNVKMPKRTARKISKKSPTDILPTKLLRWYEVLRVFPGVAAAVGKRSVPLRDSRGPVVQLVVARCSETRQRKERPSRRMGRGDELLSPRPILPARLCLRLTGFPSSECLRGRSKSVGGSICQYHVEDEALAFKSYWLCPSDVPHLFLLTSDG